MPIDEEVEVYRGYELERDKLSTGRFLLWARNEDFTDSFCFGIRLDETEEQAWARIKTAIDKKLGEPNGN